MSKSILQSSVLLIFFYACTFENGTKSKPELYPEKNYVLNLNGRIESTEMYLSDFDSAQSCKVCHQSHYDEWSRSMHAFAMQDPVFIKGWLKEQEQHPETGERFCIQCHNPPAFVTGEYLNGYETTDYFPPMINEGISCDFCHSVTDLSNTVHTPDNAAAVAEYHLNPGEGIKYGSLENPEKNDYHESQYHPIFKRSDFCLPCHNMTVRNVEVEMTFTEWRRIPGNDMSDLNSCQSCHMPIKTNGNHNHEFTGVDINLNNAPGTILYEQQYNSVLKLMQNAVILEFSGATEEDIVRIIGDSLYIPVKITSLTQHSLPSGTSFSREAWLEIQVINSESQELLFSSGLIDDLSDLNLNDENLLLFTSYLLDKNGDVTESVSQAHDIIKQMLPPSPPRYHLYKFIGDFNSVNQFEINIRMRFRAFKPHLLREDHPELLQNLPVFEMATLQDTVYIQSSR